MCPSLTLKELMHPLKPHDYLYTPAYLSIFCIGWYIFWPVDLISIKCNCSIYPQHSR